MRRRPPPQQEGGNNNSQKRSIQFRFQSTRSDSENSHDEYYPTAASATSTTTASSSSSPRTTPRRHNNNNNNQKPTSFISAIPQKLERWVRLFKQEWKTLWKLLLALVAIMDLLGCWPVLVEGWSTAVSHRLTSTGTTTSSGGSSNGLVSWDILWFLSKTKNSDHDSDDSDEDDDSSSSFTFMNFDSCYQDNNNQNQNQHQDSSFIMGNTGISTANDLTCATHALYYEMMGTAQSVFHWMGPLFCCLCILEAIRRAQQAREDMLEMAALDQFEQKLSRLYGSTRRLSFSMQQDPNTTTMAQQQQQQRRNNSINNTTNSSHSSDSLETTYEQDDILARRTLRFWTPVLSTLLLWSLLLPWKTILSKQCGPEVDTSIATYWITQGIAQMKTLASKVMDAVLGWAWSLLLPLSSLWKPHKLYLRILKLLRWVRYFRFAGPLMRVLLKLNDQFFVFFKTKQQSWKLKAEKAKREMHRSMLFEDIRKVESYNKLSRFWAKVPTWQLFHAAKEQPAEVGGRLQDKKKQSTKLKRQLDDLKAQVRKSPKAFPTSEIYDRIADLSKEFTTTVGSTLWSANLIPPQTRFSLSWRVIVTCALLSEVTRICTSYQLYGRVDVSYTTMMMSVLGCANHGGGGNILTATGRLARKWVRALVRLPKEQLLSTCTMASIQAHGGVRANFLIYFSSIYEMVIDLVCFIDIYVWFFTGELDLNGRVVPKPFFYRCILPGTLVQVLDHPTVPDVLPNILAFSLSAASAVGYSRMIRWLVAIVPAFNILLVDMIKSFLFRPMEDEEWLQYTESMAILPVLSGADIRFAMNQSHPNFSDFQGQEALQSLRRSVTIERNVNLTQPANPVARMPVRRVVSNSPVKPRLQHQPKLTSFVPLVPSLGELRRDLSSAGLNLDDSFSAHNMDTSIDQSYSLDQILVQESPKTDHSRRRALQGPSKSTMLSPYAKKKFVPQLDIMTIESIGDLNLDDDDTTSNGDGSRGYFNNNAGS